MTAASVSVTWSRRVASFQRFVSTQTAGVGEIHSAAAGHTKLRFLDARWKELEDGFTKIEENYPEPDDLDSDVSDASEPYRDRQEQREGATLAYSACYEAITNRIAAFEVTVAPPIVEAPVELTRTQRAATMGNKRARVYREVMKSISVLGQDILAQTASDNLALAMCFDEERKRIWIMVSQLEEMAMEIQETDPAVYRRAMATQEKQAHEIEQAINPVETALARFSQACKEKAQAVDDAIRRKSASELPGVREQNVKQNDCKTIAKRWYDFLLFPL